jgi:fucose 4-O-acetylase-like acetyltransferase
MVVMNGTSADPDQPSTAEPHHSGGDRLAYLDVLRVAVIVMVVAHHAAQPYGPTGGDWPVTDPANSAWLEPFFLVNIAFGMGLLFLLAGYFVPRSYDRKGAGRFLKDRWMRIGVPLVIFVLVVQVPVVYLIESPRPSLGEFIRSLYDSGWQNAYIHLWFLGHLLLYSVGYVAWRQIADRRTDRPPRIWSPPNHAAIVGFVVGLALVTWVVRGWYPIDEWVPLFFVLAAEPAHLPQYVSLFALGVVAYRGDWLGRLSTKVGMIWLSIGLVASAGIYAALLLAPDWWNDVVASGEFNWRSLLKSTWEALICAGMCVGLIVLFRSLIRRTNRLLMAMAAASYAAYILHFTFVVGLQAGMAGLDLPALVKFGLVTALGVLLAFGTGHLSRRVPGLRAILGTAPKEGR